MVENLNLNISSVLTLTGGRLVSSNPADVVISGVAALKEACEHEASFLGNEKYFNDFLATKAGVVLIPPGLPELPEGTCLIEVDNPSLAFNALVKHFLAATSSFRPGVHPTAIVDARAVFDPAQVSIGPHVVIDAHVTIGDGTHIGPGCVIGEGASIGKQCKLHARVIVRERCILKNRVTIQPGAVIGSDGFGFLMGEQGKYIGIDQVGIVVLEDDVDIGANTTIDRARFGRTIIGEDTKIDNLVQIGHNVVVGKHCVIVSQSGVAGSTVIEDYCTIAAQVGITGHLRIGTKARLGARTGVMTDLAPNKDYWGLPATEAKAASRQFVAITKLPALIKEFRAFKRSVEEWMRNK